MQTTGNTLPFINLTPRRKYAIFMGQENRFFEKLA